MKKICVLIVMTIAILGSTVQAQERQMFKMAVPFNFTAEDTVFPAGSYIFYLVNPYKIRIQSRDGWHVANVSGMPLQKFGSSEKSALVFQRIDGKFFLIRIQEQSTRVQRELTLGSEARELQARDRDGYPSSVAISAR